MNQLKLERLRKGIKKMKLFYVLPFLAVALAAGCSSGADYPKQSKENADLKTQYNQELANEFDRYDQNPAFVGWEPGDTEKARLAFQANELRKKENALNAPAAMRVVDESEEAALERARREDNAAHAINLN